MALQGYGVTSRCRRLGKEKGQDSLALLLLLFLLCLDLFCFILFCFLLEKGAFMCLAPEMLKIHFMPDSFLGTSTSASVQGTQFQTLLHGQAMNLPYTSVP